MQAKKQSRNLSVPQTGFGQNWDCMHGKHKLTISLMHDICSSAMAIALVGNRPSGRASAQPSKVLLCDSKPQGNTKQ